MSLALEFIRSYRVGLKTSILIINRTAVKSYFPFHNFDHTTLDEESTFKKLFLKKMQQFKIFS